MLATGTDLLLEYEYRSAFPEISHLQFLEMMADRDLLEKIRGELRAELGLQGYAAIMRVSLNMAKKGSVSHSEFVFKQLGLSIDGKPDGEGLQAGSVGDMIKSFTRGIAEALTQNRVDRQPPPIDVKAEVQ